MADRDLCLDEQLVCECEIGSTTTCQFGLGKEKWGYGENVPVVIEDISDDGKLYLVRKLGLSFMGVAIRKDKMPEHMRPNIKGEFFSQTFVGFDNLAIKWTGVKNAADAMAYLGF